MKTDIISMLRTNRAGLLLEGVDASVKNGFKDFLNRAKLGSKDKGEVRQILNDLFLCADSIGKNTFKYGKIETTAAEFDQGDAENGPGTAYSPATASLKFYIFFDNGDTATENLDTLTIAMRKKHHKMNCGPDGEWAIDHNWPELDNYEGPVVYVTPNPRKGYLEVLVTACITEGTDISGVTTPDGKVGAVEKRKEVEVLTEKMSEAEIVCPKCGSTDVNIHNDGTVFHCVPCGYEWSVNDADACGKLDDEETPEEIKGHSKKSVKAEDEDKKSVKESWNASEFLVPGGRYATESMGYIQVLRVTEGACVIRNEASKQVTTMPLDEATMKNWVEVRLPIE